MVYWGPWQTGLLYEQRLISHKTGTPIVEWKGQTHPDGELLPLPAGDAPVSGWYLRQEGGYAALGNASKNHASPILIEPEVDREVVIAALNAARGDVVESDVTGSSGLAGFSAAHTMIYGGLGVWHQVDAYGFFGKVWILHHHGHQSAGLAGIPEFESWPEGATIAQMEPVEPLVVSEDPFVVQDGAHSNFVLTLEDAKVEQWSHGGSLEGEPVSWLGYVRAISTQAGWLDAGGSMNAAVRTVSTSGPGGVSLSLTELNQLMIDDALLTNPSTPSIPAPDNDIPHTDPRWPQFIVSITAEDIGTPSVICNAETGPSVLLRLRTPRYRYGYDEPVIEPYRRNFPRDVRRNWPLPKAIQAGNRNVGGYV